jgi:hypothetical protein
MIAAVRCHNERVYRAIKIDEAYGGAIPESAVVLREHPEFMYVAGDLLDNVLMSESIERWACDDWIIRFDRVLANKDNPYLQFVTSSLCEPADLLFDAFGRDFITDSPRWMRSRSGIEMIIERPRDDPDALECIPTFREMVWWAKEVSRTDAAKNAVSFNAGGDRATRAERDYRASRDIRETARMRTIAVKRAAKKGADTAQGASDAPQP